MFSSERPFTDKPPQSSSIISAQPYNARKDWVASDLYGLLHSESAYFDDRDDDKKGQYKESVNEGETISGADEEDDNDEDKKKTSVEKKTVGLKAAMAKAALPVEDVSSKKKTKNGANNEQNSNCILSLKGNS